MDFKKLIADLGVLEENELIFLSSWVAKNKPEFVSDFEKARQDFKIFDSFFITEKLQSRHPDFCTYVETNFKNSKNIKLLKNPRRVEFNERGLVEVLVKYRNSDLEFIEELLNKKLI